METKRRRIKRGKVSAKLSTNKKEELVKILDKHVGLQVKANKIKDEMGELQKRAEVLAKVGKITEMQTAKAEFTFKATKGNSSTFIDPEKLFDELQDRDDYFASVKVIAKNVKKFLGEKSLAKISTTTAGKLGAATAVIKPRKAN